MNMPLLSSSTGIDAKINMAIDGNSLIEGNILPEGNQYYIAKQIDSFGALQDAGIVTQKIGVGGNTWQVMTGNVSGVSAGFVEGKRNVLYALEGTNSSASRTAEEMAQDASAYAAAMKGADDWEVYVITTIPYRTFGANAFDQAVVDKILDYNNILKSDFKTLGFDGVVDIVNPDYSPFYLASFEDAAWESISYLYTDSETLSASGNYVHPNLLGSYYIAKMIYQHAISI